MQNNLQADKDAICETINAYCDGHALLSAEKLLLAFHPKAQIAGYYQGKLEILSRDNYIQIILTSKTGTDTKIEIKTIQQCETVAQVTINNTMMGDDFISYLSLIKTKNIWQIISGLYQQEVSE